MTRISLFLALGFAACTPHTADIEEGEYIAYLATNTSQTLFEDKLNFDNAEVSFNIDCRDVDAADRLEGAIDICDRNWKRANESWVANDAFRAIGGTLDPWRGEAIITSEGDVQVGFHQRLPGGQDFRFSFTIDPNFRPQRCSEDANGEPIAAEIDGNWLEEWSKDVDSGLQYYLTNGAFQFNPDETARIWTLPQEWRSGMAIAHFGAEDFAVRPPYYGMPSAYSGFVESDGSAAVSPAALFWSNMSEGDDPTTNSAHQRLITRVDGVATDTNEEFVDLRSPIVSSVHTNEWRMPDNSAAGLDSWVELHYSWVRFDEGTTFEKGEPLSGEFQLMFDAIESQSRLAVRGTFSVDKLKRDRWVTDDVTAAKLEEAGTVLCVGRDGADNTGNADTE